VVPFLATPDHLRNSIEARLGDSGDNFEPQHPPAHPRHVAIARFYDGISGFSSSGAGPSGRKLRPARAHVYGELTSVGVRQLIRATRLGADDVFVDLGSGVGKVVLRIALAVPGVRCIGMEIDGARHANACEALRRAEACGALEPGRCVFQHGDIRQADLGNATVLFAHSTCFPAAMLGGLARRIAAQDRAMTLVTTNRLIGRAGKLLVFAATRACQLSWDKHHRMHLYRSRVDGNGG
jgi:hypothetical protein